MSASPKRWRRRIVLMELAIATVAIGLLLWVLAMGLFGIGDFGHQTITR